eukprot:162008-Chlamydomonas_euryale.AAC.2
MSPSPACGRSQGRTRRPVCAGGDGAVAAVAGAAAARSPSRLVHSAASARSTRAPLPPATTAMPGDGGPGGDESQSAPAPAGAPLAAASACCSIVCSFCGRPSSRGGERGAAGPLRAAEAAFVAGCSAPSLSVDVPSLGTAVCAAPPAAGGRDGATGGSPQPAATSSCPFPSTMNTPLETDKPLLLPPPLLPHGTDAAPPASGVADGDIATLLATDAPADESSSMLLRALGVVAHRDDLHGANTRVAHALLMRCTCTANALYMHRTCTKHMRCTCVAHALHMRCSCVAHALHMRCSCVAHALQMRCSCVVHALQMRCMTRTHALMDMPVCAGGGRGRRPSARREGSSQCCATRSIVRPVAFVT